MLYSKSEALFKVGLLIIVAKIVMGLLGVPF